jgi:hypothetical protein
MRYLVFVIACSLVITTLACERSQETVASDAVAASEPANEAGAPAATSFMLIEGLGIEIQVPAGAEIMDSGANYMVSAHTPQCTLLVGKVGDMSPSYESTLNAIKGGMAGGELKEIFEETRTEDGWVINYSTKSMMDPDATRYGINVRVKAGDHHFDCSRVANDQAHSACVLEACKSIRVPAAG